MAEHPGERLKGVRLGFIGAGSMGGAIIRGLLTAAQIPPADLWFYDPEPEKQQEFQGLGIIPAPDNAAVMKAALVILAVKPQVLGAVLKEIRDHTRPGQVVISIAAGVPLAVLEKALPKAQVIRAMPNTPLLVQAGMTALSPGSRATHENVALALEVFRAVGRAEVVPEAYLDAITALSGSGPAFVAVFLEALADGAVKMGLPRTLALEFAAQTLLGTAHLILGKNLHPALLKDLVASPGGTTIHGLHALEQGAFRAAVISAIEAATWRAQDLAEMGKWDAGGGPGNR
ncbi:MAG: pyrroline-5-carboxylate reductase [Desulfobaccales bacterium]